MIPIIRPDVTFEEVEGDIRRILASGILTSGPFVEEFEAQVANAVGAKHAVATTSATTAIHLVLAALDIGPGDEVLVSDFTFPATGNVVAQLGARPVLVDCAEGSFALDVSHAESLVTSRTRAILAVDPFGQPAPLQQLEQLASTRGLALIEDAACALGAAASGRACGAWGSAGCFSFHPRKVVTTGEGGMVTTNDGDLAARMRRLRSHGGRAAAVGMEFIEHGFNYRLGEVPAALGLAQLRRLDAILRDRRETAQRYESELAGFDGIVVPRASESDSWSYQSFVVRVDAAERDDIIHALRSAGVEATLGTYAMHAHDAFVPYGYRPGALPQSFKAQQESLTLPLLPRMTLSQLRTVLDALRGAMAASGVRGAPSVS